MRSYTPKHLADKILHSKSALEGERKQVTVLFADVKGSMELAEQLDPEEWHQILDRFFQILTEGVHRFEGTVNQYTGDGIMALFGAPIAHEDHAQRACYAALRAAEELRRYAHDLKRERGLSFATRLGLNSGDVVVGKIGDDLRMDYTAQGHTVGLAARMEQLADPGKTYLSQYTARLVEGFFQLADLGEFNVKGVQGPLRVYELEGVGPLRTRIDAAARRGLVRFVGRHGEMEQVRRAAAAAADGHGQIVAVVGEAGVGKSRLYYEFKARLPPGASLLEAFSVSHGKAYAYLPLIDLLKGYFQIGLEDDERARREKITGKVLALDRALENTLQYLFPLLDVADPRSSLAQMDPQTRRQRTMEAVKRVLLRETLNQPLILIFEDLHWVDSETQAFLDVLADSLATARLLLLVNYRPQYQHGWGSKTYYTQLRLDPLGEAEAGELLKALLGDGTAAEIEPLKRLIIEKTEGNPFFMEEVVQSLAEEGALLGARGAYRLKGPVTELHVPATVQGVLAARIDRLPGEDKELLQTLAVIGTEFPLDLARRVTGRPDDELQRLLGHLQVAEFIYEQPAYPEPEYTFKHALTQDVAYQAVLVERRKVVHERTARAIEELYVTSLEKHYADLAHHYGRTDNTPKAVEYLHLAGQQAFERSAYDEAIARLERSLALLATMPESTERDHKELLLQTAIGPALRIMKGFTAPAVEKAFGRATQLCERLGESPVQALFGLWIFYQARPDLDRAADLAAQILERARHADDLLLLYMGHQASGATLYWRGRLNEASEHLQQAYEVGLPLQRHLVSLPIPISFNMEEGFAATRGFRAITLCMLGYPEQALLAASESLALARAQGRPVAVAMALLYEAGMLRIVGKPREARERAEALAALATEHGFMDFAGMAMLLRGAALAEDGPVEEGITDLRTALEAMKARGAEVAWPYYASFLGEAYGRAGKAAQGLVTIEEAIQLANRIGGYVSEPALYRAKGNLLLTLSADKQAEAEACFRHSIAVARRQGAKLAELQAATSLSRLWQKQGKKEEARALLEAIYGWFTEGFDLRYLREARALLEELV